MSACFKLTRKHGKGPVYTKTKDFGTSTIVHLVAWSNIFDHHVYKAHFPNCSPLTQVVLAGIRWDFARRRTLCP